MYVSNTLGIRQTRHEYAKYTPNIENNVNCSAYESVLEDFSHVGIRWLNRHGVAAP